MVVLSAVTAFAVLSGGKQSHAPAPRKRTQPAQQWETRMAAQGTDLLRILKAL